MSTSITLEPELPATHSILWFHGLGAYADDFANVAQVLNLPEECSVRHVCPQAPLMPVTLNNGMVMPAWYDLYGIKFEAKEDKEGIQAAFEFVKTLIQTEIDRGIPSHRILLAGFSMGAALALYSGLRYPQPLGGIIGLSGYLPLSNEFPELAQADRSCPIFLAYGTQDDIVLPEWTAAIASGLALMGFKACTTHAYRMTHMVCPEELRDLSDWLAQVLMR